MTTKPKTITEWAESRFGFYVDRYFDRARGRWVLKPGSIRLAGYHRAILEHCFTPDADGRLPYDVIAWCEPAKSGKSAIAGLVSEWMALHGEQNSTIVMLSNKQDQAASLMYRSLAESVRLNPHLPFADPGKLAVTFANGNEVRAAPSNSRGEAGARFSLAVFDELWGYQYEDAQRLWSEFKTDPTRLNSLKFAIGYAGYMESTLWRELLESGLGGEPVPELADIVNDDNTPACWANGRTFVFWSHVCRQPWQTPAWIESQRKTLRPAEFLRMIETRFVESVGNFCEQSLWESLIDPELKPLPPGSETPVYIGLDLALAAGGDNCVTVGVYNDGLDRIKTAFVKVWRGDERREQLRLRDTVFPFLLRAADDYHLAGIFYDPWQSALLAEELKRHKIRTFPVTQSRENRAPRDTSLLEMVNNRQLVLLDDPELRTAAAGANVLELGNGLIFIKKATGKSKIDTLIALSNVCLSALRANRPQRQPRLHDGLSSSPHEQKIVLTTHRTGLPTTSDESGPGFVAEIMSEMALCKTREDLLRMREAYPKIFALFEIQYPHRARLAKGKP